MKKILSLVSFLFLMSIGLNAHADKPNGHQSRGDNRNHHAKQKHHKGYKKRYQQQRENLKRELYSSFNDGARSAKQEYREEMMEIYSNKRYHPPSDKTYHTRTIQHDDVDPKIKLKVNLGKHHKITYEL